MTAADARVIEGRARPTGHCTDFGASSAPRMTITLLDVILLAVMLISAALAMVRGFTREVLSIASWVAAAAATFYFFEPARALAREYIHVKPPQIADVIGAGMKGA